MRRLIESGMLSLALLGYGPGAPLVEPVYAAAEPRIVQAETGSRPSAGANGQAETEAAKADDEEHDDELSPEETMRRRFPQPVTAGELIGRPVLNENRSTIGRVQQVVRTPAGKIELIITYGGFLGIGKRLIAIPLEAVAAIGLYVAVVDIDNDDLDATETWEGSDSKSIAANETIRIAVTAR